MAPEFGATCGFFPIDQATINYLRLTGRSEERIALVEAYAKAQGMWRDATSAEPVFTDTLELDISSVEPSLAGPSARRTACCCRACPPATTMNWPTAIKRARKPQSAYRSEEHTSELQSLMRISYAV